MTLMRRAAVAVAVLSVAAIPVAALTIKNSSTEDVKIAVDTGSSETVYTVPAGGSVEAREDCSAACGVTGPWSYSRLVNQNAVIDTDGTSLITVAPQGTPGMAALVPQNPATDLETASIATENKSAAAPDPEPAPRKRRIRQAAKKAAPAGAGSFDLLFNGPSKKK